MVVLQRFFVILTSISKGILRGGWSNLTRFPCFSMFFPQGLEITPPQLAMHWHNQLLLLGLQYFWVLWPSLEQSGGGGNTTRSLQNNRVCVCVCSRSLSTSGLRVKAVFLLKNTSEHHLGQFLVRNPFCCMPHFVVHYGEGAAKMTQHESK